MVTQRVVRGPAPLNDLLEVTRLARSLTSVQFIFLCEKVDLTSQKPTNGWNVWTPLQSFCTYKGFHFIWTKSAVNQVMAPLWSSQCNSSYLSNWSMTQPKKDAINGNAICYRLGSFVEMLSNRHKFLIFSLRVADGTARRSASVRLCACDKEEIWRGTKTEGDAHRQLITRPLQSWGIHQKINALLTAPLISMRARRQLTRHGKTLLTNREGHIAKI